MVLGVIGAQGDLNASHPKCNCNTTKINSAVLAGSASASRRLSLDAAIPLLGPDVMQREEERVVG